MDTASTASWMKLAVRTARSADHTRFCMNLRARAIPTKPSPMKPVTLTIPAQEISTPDAAQSAQGCQRCAGESSTARRPSSTPTSAKPSMTASL